MSSNGLVLTVAILSTVYLTYGTLHAVMTALAWTAWAFVVVNFIRHMVS